jgi:hypothetical protein
MNADSTIKREFSARIVIERFEIRKKAESSQKSPS